MHYADTYILLSFKSVLRIRIRSDPVFLGHPDPDPDPGKYRIRSRILFPQKDSCNSNFLVIKLSKIQFRPNTFLSLILSVIGCLDLVRKCHNKNIYFTTHQKHI